MMMSDPGESALEWIRTAIREERPQLHPDDVALMALTFDAIADDYGVPVEELVVWIHSQTFDVEAPDAWRAHCREYAALRARLCS